MLDSALPLCWAWMVGVCSVPTGVRLKLHPTLSAPRGQGLWLVDEYALTLVRRSRKPCHLTAFAGFFREKCCNAYTALLGVSLQGLCSTLGPQPLVYNAHDPSVVWTFACSHHWGLYRTPTVYRLLVVVTLCTGALLLPRSVTCLSF